MIDVKWGFDRSRDVAMATNFSLLNPDNFFRHSHQCAINFVQVIHDVFDRPKCSTQGHPRGFLLIIPIHRETVISPWTFPPSDISLTLACDGMRQEVQMLRGRDAREPIN